VALVGSGEFLPVMRDVDRQLLAGRPARVAVMPTAAGLEGTARVRYWFDLAQSHYRALGAEVVEIPVLARADAEEPRWSDAIAGCGLVYLSGGDPLHLVTTIRATPVWEAIRSAWVAGAALAGCSAGAMALAGTVLSVRRGGPPIDGLGVVAPIAVLPHFDRFSRRVDLDAVRASLPSDVRLVGVDEDTAAVSDDLHTWSVAGRAGAHLYLSNGTVSHATAGASLTW
jgi:cyanophycinase-like exopeptidase